MSIFTTEYTYKFSIMFLNISINVHICLCVIYLPNPILKNNINGKTGETK